MKDKLTEKEIIKIEVERKLEALRIHQTLLDPTLLSNAKADRMKLFQYVGSFLKCIYFILDQKLRSINLKIKKNATKP